MSFRHIEELSAVRDEFDAMRAATAYVREDWSRAGSTLAPIKLYELIEAAEKLEATYIVRLTAGYEAIVFEALRKQSGRKIDDKASGADLTNQLAGWLQELIKLTSTARLSASERRRITEIKQRAEEVRKLLRYRNKLAHRKPPENEDFNFRSARNCLNLLLDLIP